MSHSIFLPSSPAFCLPFRLPPTSPNSPAHAFVSTYPSSPASRRSPLRRPRTTRALFESPSSSSTTSTTPPKPQQYTVYDWSFKSFRVQYATTLPQSQQALHETPVVVLVHGFGANCRHWRKNLQPLADRGFRVYALDLLGFGMGDKPTPGTLDSDGNKVEYTFDYWTAQLTHFLDTVVHPQHPPLHNNNTYDSTAVSEQPTTTPHQTANNPQLTLTENEANTTTILNDPSNQTCRPVYLVANSIGCMVTMQFAIQQPHRVAALAFISPSLRQLNVRKRSWLQDITAPFLMRLLCYKPIGAFFLDSLSKPKALRRVLNQAYAVSDAVDDDLIRILREPAMTPGALDVFLSFISYDTGPIPEDFLPDLTKPALVLWGEEDQFEPFELGQKLRHYSIVESFVPLPETGHCAHDERPEKCNQLIGDFLDKHHQKTNGTDSIDK